MELKTISFLIDNKRIKSLLPSSKYELESILKNVDSYSTRALALSLATSSIRKEQHNVDWVKQNGMCMENIRSGTSTIPAAGRGAFANRFLAEGSLISPAPLVQIMDRQNLLMYEMVYDEEFHYNVRASDEPITSQLLLNYCFGHEKSRMLLCPETNVVLMNHCSSRLPVDGECATQGPNAKIRWAGKWHPSTAKWLNLTFEELDALYLEGNPGLAFDFVATRDINEGEEIFIDYGVDWEAAWKTYKDTWVPPAQEDAEQYIPLSVLLRDGIELRTVADLKHNPYPSHILQVCLFVDKYDDDTESTRYERNDDADLVIENGSMFNTSQFSMLDGILPFYPCDILEKDEASSLLTIRIDPVFDGDDRVMIKNYPVEFVRFRIAEYYSDQHLRHAFRHHISIPDDLFPDQWKVHTAPNITMQWYEDIVR